MQERQQAQRASERGAEYDVLTAQVAVAEAEEQLLAAKLARMRLSRDARKVIVLSSVYKQTQLTHEASAGCGSCSSGLALLTEFYAAGAWAAPSPSSQSRSVVPRAAWFESASCDPKNDEAPLGQLIEIGARARTAQPPAAANFSIVAKPAQASLAHMLLTHPAAIAGCQSRSAAT